MKELIKQIKEGSIIIIDNLFISVLSKAFYVTESNPNEKYVKVFLEKHYVLVIAPDSQMIYFGKDFGALLPEFPTPEGIVYQNKKYKRIIQDYQILVELEFGNPLTTEGEVKFIDYECVDDSSLILSIGKIVKNESRADIVARFVDINEIKIK